MINVEALQNPKIRENYVIKVDFALKQMQTSEVYKLNK